MTVKILAVYKTTLENIKVNIAGKKVRQMKIFINDKFRQYSYVGPLRSP